VIFAGLHRSIKHAIGVGSTLSLVFFTVSIFNSMGVVSGVLAIIAGVASVGAGVPVVVLGVIPAGGGAEFASCRAKHSMVRKTAEFPRARWSQGRRSAHCFAARRALGRAPCQNSPRAKPTPGDNRNDGDYSENPDKPRPIRDNSRRSARPHWTLGRSFTASAYSATTFSSSSPR